MDYLQINIYIFLVNFHFNTIPLSLPICEYLLHEVNKIGRIDTNIQITALFYVHRNCIKQWKLDIGHLNFSLVIVYKAMKYDRFLRNGWTKYILGNVLITMTQRTQTYYTVVYLMPTQCNFRAFSFHYLPSTFTVISWTCSEMPNVMMNLIDDAHLSRCDLQIWHESILINYDYLPKNYEMPSVWNRLNL